MSRLVRGLLLIGVVLAFAARLPGLAQPLGIDQGIFATAGWGLQQGLGLYTDLWDQKPPAIHLTYAAAFTVAGPHARAVFWADFVAAVLTCLLLAIAAGRAAGRQAALPTAFLFALLTIPAARFGYGGFLERAVPESFILFLAAGAALLVVRSASAAAGLVAGVLIGCAVVYKPTALIYWPAFLLWLRLCGRPLRPFAVASGAGLAVPAILVAGWLWWEGGLTEAWIATIEYNRAYVGAGAGPVVLMDRVAHEVWRWIKTDPLWTLGGSALLVAFLTAVANRRMPHPAPLLAACWLGAVVIAAAANGVRLYATYFIPAAAPLALAGGWLVGAAFGNANRRSAVLAVAPLLLSGVVAFRSASVARAWSATAADLRVLRSESGRLAYLERFGGYNTGRGYSARANAELTAYLLAHTAPEDRVYIFGMAPSVYFTARRLPANRFLWTYPGVTNLVRRDAFTVAALAHDLAAAAPAMIVLEHNNRDSLTGWRIEQDFESAPMQELLREYRREGAIEDFVLYRRTGERERR